MKGRLAFVGVARGLLVKVPDDRVASLANFALHKKYNTMVRCRFGRRFDLFVCCWGRVEWLKVHHLVEGDGEGRGGEERGRQQRECC